MDSEIIRAVQKENLSSKNKQVVLIKINIFSYSNPMNIFIAFYMSRWSQSLKFILKFLPQPSRGSVNKISDDLYKDVITPLQAEFREPIVSPHWWKKPADNFKGFAAKTRINNTIWRQWFKTT